MPDPVLRSIKPLALAMPIVILIAACGASAGSPAAGSPTSPGADGSSAGADCVIGGTVTQIRGATARVFCGPAKVSLSLAGKVVTFSDGACETLGDAFTVNVGTFYAGDPPKPDYFGLTAFGADDPPLEEAPAIVWVKDGVGGSLAVSDPVEMTLSTDLQHVTFSGKLSGSGADVTGTVDC